MHHIDLGLFKYQLEFTQEILKKVGGTELQKVFDERLRQVPRFSGLKLFSKFGQLKIMTIHETEIKPPGSKWSGPGPPRVEIGSK